MALLLAGGATAVRGQSALDGFDPNADGAIEVVVVQPDGKILLGGQFTTLTPNGGAAVTRNRIARLNPDGTLDAAFDPNANNTVSAIAVQADGKILLGGQFTTLAPNGGAAVTRNRIARLHMDGTLDAAFNPNANNTVLAIAVQADGKIVVGGFFNGANCIGGQTRNFIARLNSGGTVETAFNLNANNSVLALVVQTDGKILVGGGFSGANSIGGQTRNRLARLDLDGTVETAFDPNANGGVFSMAAQADGKILAGGDFTMMGGLARSKMARLNENGTLDTAFDPNAQNRVSAIAVQPDGKILAGGFFTGANSIGGQTRNRIARLEPGAGLADSFNPNASGTVLAIAVQADGKILAGGSFNGASSIGGLTRNRIARLETDGGVDRTLDLSMNPGNLFATAVQADGKILIGGGFSTVLGMTRNNIVRLNSDGTLDSNFNPNANGFVYAIAVQADGKIVVGGDFTFVTGQPRNRIARLDSTTGFVDSFNPNADNGVRALALQADGKILVSGNFANIGGATRNNMARLDAATGLADSFDANVSGRPNAIAVQPDGRIIIGGIFNSVAGMTRNNMARLNSDGTLDAVFNPNANNVVNAIALQADGKVLAGGDFNVIGGEPRNRIARLDPTTGLPDSFNPNANSIVNAIAVQGDGRILAAGFFNGVNSIGGQTRNRVARLDPNIGLADSFHPNASGVVFSLALQGDGKVLAGGGFLTIGGQPRTIFARLSNDTAALQNLAVTHTSITWTRGGASPQFTRVIFEFSTDNVNYALLGDGMGSGSNWALTGLSLATEQNFYIRARGYYRSGYGGGSESTVESVRNVFLTPQPRLNIQRSANTDVVLSWAAKFTGFTLEANTNLNTSVWNVVSPPPAVSGTNNVVTNAAIGPARFYRLRK